MASPVYLAQCSSYWYLVNIYVFGETGRMANKEVEWQFILDKVCHALISQLKIVTPALTELHWLPITARVQYRLCLLMHSAAVGTAPDYLKNMLQPVSERASQKALRLATNNDMAMPCSRLKFGERAFSVAAPRAWNSIPADLRTTLNTAMFKTT